MQLLTLAPKSWTIRYKANYFVVSRYLVQKAFKLRGDTGICSMLPKKAGKSLPPWVITNIRQFYEDDQNSRLLPGKKGDFFSVARNEDVKKRLLLCNLKELYQYFKNKFSRYILGFSKFCTLRPRWCVTVHASGAHAVCVCTIHQNVILLADATKTGLSYNDMIIMIVCDSESKMCILHRFPSCPGSNNLQSFLESHFSDLDYEVTFQQWQSSNRMDLIQQTLEVKDFLQLTVNSIDKIITHSYVVKCQGRYVKGCKDMVLVLVLADIC